MAVAETNAAAKSPLLLSATANAILSVAAGIASRASTTAFPLPPRPPRLPLRPPPLVRLAVGSFVAVASPLPCRLCCPRFLPASPLVLPGSLGVSRGRRRRLQKRPLSGLGILAVLSQTSPEGLQQGLQQKLQQSLQQGLGLWVSSAC